MLFTEFSFIFVFLPVTLLVYHSMPTTRLAIASLVAASLIFYGLWNVYFVPMLLFAIVSNYLVARQLERSGNRIWFIGGILLALTPLFYFKYSGLFVQTAGLGIEKGLFGEKLGALLPLGISFYTFQQILYLADVNAGKIRTAGLLDYAFFKLFFPQLIAGPIVHYRQLIPQIGQNVDREKMFVEGCAYFALGFAKKFFLADGLAAFSDPVFDGSSPIGTQAALTAALGYTFQLYFDFSGYSDMAMGLARMFGFELPWNFNSPYKAASISDFWRRWHMTLSQFLRDYVYIPLGGNRAGEFQRYRNLILTMLIGGLWHGAAWTFVVWGALHGVFLAVNHLWDRFAGIKLGIAGKIATFVIVSLLWVLFRASGFGRALEIYGGLLRFDPLKPDQFWIWAGIAGALCFFGPNSHQIVERVSGHRLRPRNFSAVGLARNLGAFSVLSSGVLVAIAGFYYSQPVDRWAYQRMSAPSDSAGITNRSGDFRNNLWRKDLFARDEPRIAFVGSSFAVAKGRYAVRRSADGPPLAVTESLALGGNGLLNGAREAAEIIATRSADVIVLSVSPLNFGSSLTIVPFPGQCVDGLLDAAQRRKFKIAQLPMGGCGPAPLEQANLFKIFDANRASAAQFRNFLRNAAVSTVSRRGDFADLAIEPALLAERLAKIKARMAAIRADGRPAGDQRNGADATFKWNERKVGSSLDREGLGAAILRDLADKARRNGIIFAVYETPTAKRQFAPQVYPAGFFEDYQRRLRLALQENGIAYLDLSDFAPWNNSAMTDFIHARDEVREMVFQTVLIWLFAPDALARSGLLQGGQIPTVQGMEKLKP